MKQYYRLRVVDVNGALKVSNIIIISGSRPATLVLNGLFPNPVSARLNVLVEAPAKNTVTIQVMDAMGRLVKTQRNLVDAGSNTLELNVTGLSLGSYVLKISCENGCQPVVGKFIKE